VTALIAWLVGLPDLLVYLTLAAGAAVENVVPAVPADTFVALGGLLAGAGDLDWRWVVAGTWIANVGSALVVYRMSYLYGSAFFDSSWGRSVLKPHQMERMRGFYARWGLPAIFFSRFLPGVRAVVPIFAGATHQPALKVMSPLALASAIWYGGLVLLGMWAGQNLGLLGEVLSGVNSWLGVLAILVGALSVAWWIRTRKEPDE